MRSAAEREVRVNTWRGRGGTVSRFCLRRVGFGKAVRRGFLSFVWWRTTQQQNLYQRLSRGPMDGEALHEARREPGGARFPKDIVTPRRPASTWTVCHRTRSEIGGCRILCMITIWLQTRTRQPKLPL